MSHEKSHKQAENKKKLKCPKCDRIFSNLTDLKTHEITHKISQKKETHFKCKKCGQNFTGSAMLNTCVLIFKKDLSDCHKLKNFSAAAPVTESLEEKRI